MKNKKLIIGIIIIIILIIILISIIYYKKINSNIVIENKVEKIETKKTGFTEEDYKNLLPKKPLTEEEKKQFYGDIENLSSKEEMSEERKKQFQESLERLTQELKNNITE